MNEEKIGNKLPRFVRFIISYIPEFCALTACDLLHTNTHAHTTFQCSCPVKNKNSSYTFTKIQFRPVYSLILKKNCVYRRNLCLFRSFIYLFIYSFHTFRSFADSEYSILFLKLFIKPTEWNHKYGQHTRE